jgi:integrase
MTTRIALSKFGRWPPALGLSSERATNRDFLGKPLVKAVPYRVCRSGLAGRGCREKHGDGLRLHQLRHSSLTHLAETGVGTITLMAKSGHKNLRSLQRYAKPSFAAVAEATELLSSSRRG